MEIGYKKLDIFTVVWKGRNLIVDKYEGAHGSIVYRVSLPDGSELRMWKNKEEWNGFPGLAVIPELGELIDGYYLNQPRK